MKFRCKVTSHFGKAGEVIDASESKFTVFIGSSMYGHSYNYSDFPEILEPLPEETPVEKVAKWLSEQIYPNYVATEPWSDWQCIAQKLLDAGVDVEKLK